ncbi:hypothetical protein [Niallia sp. NCCP-28]|uniref:hypothetical protein n=1 Tax=Niallia sp. NCCP-28 TaxID=2934712 RepID=UPI002088AAB8|nr:hypothetical protein [Niallia sp. NCCP-28]GKU81176.1 hypothetical protein NCCP28_05720 [Niallia sp. NCCP-28]
MIIRRKKDITVFVEKFNELASWDGTKFYLHFVDEQNTGVITLMKYVDGSMTIYRSNELFWDIKENELSSELIWFYRKGINKQLKNIKAGA